MAGVLMFLVAFFALIIFSVWISFRVLGIKRVIVYEYQKGLKYEKGRYIRTLGPGQYWVLSRTDAIEAVDGRTEFISIVGQDVLCSDGVTLKVSLAAEFQVQDPNLAVNKNVSFRSSLYLTLQMALREIISSEKIDILLENRSGIGAKLMELASPKAAALGLKLISADVKDIMFPGEMKKAFAQVVKAQKESQAALERARGETAALRSLANAARIMDDNPNLLQLRALQALADSSGNTLVLGLPNGAIPITGKNSTSLLRPKGKEDQG